MSEETQPQCKPSLFAPLRNRNFAWIWGGQAVSLMGDSLHYIALSWFVAHRTGSAVTTGAVLMFAAIPVVFLGPFSGAFVDKYNRKNIMIWSDILRGLIVLAIPLLLWSGRLEIWHLCLVTFGHGLVSTFFSPAMRASIPNIVESDQLISANSLTTMTEHLSRAGGAAGGAVLIAAAGVGSAFVLNGVTFWVSALAITLTRIPSPPRSQESTITPSRLLRDVAEGFVFVGRSPIMLSIMILGLVLNFVMAPLAVLTPLHAERVWRTGVSGYGLVWTALSAGMLIGTLMVRPMVACLGKARAMVLGVAIEGLALASVALTPSAASGSLAFFLIGAGNYIVLVPLITWFQEMVPDQLRGRVFAALNSGFTAAQPISLAVAGVPADLFGTGATFGGAGTIVLAGAGALYLIFRAHAPAEMGRAQAQAGATGGSTPVE